MSSTLKHPAVIMPSAEVIALRQQQADERSRGFSGLSVQYQSNRDVLALTMRSGITMEIPRHLIEELANAPQAILEHELRLGIGGEVLTVPSLDIDISLPGLLRDLMGFNIQRLGGQSRSEAKAAASRTNGVKGGRPSRKQNR